MKIWLALGWLVAVALFVAPFYVAWQRPKPFAYRPADADLQELAALPTEKTGAALIKLRKAHKKELAGADLLVAAVSADGKPMVVARAEKNDDGESATGYPIPWGELDQALAARPTVQSTVHSRMGGASFRHEVFPIPGTLPTYLVATAYRAPTTWIDWKLMSICASIALGLGLIALARQAPK